VSDEGSRETLRKHLTLSVYVEDGTLGNGSSEIPDLVIRGDQSVDEVGSADNGKVEGEKQSYESKERHGEGGAPGDSWPELGKGVPRLCMWVGGGAKGIVG
jgi:hypothetical protein